MRARRHKLQVSTFPFLAVLLCAMGSLILVLLVMDRKAHQAAQVRAQREAARLAEESAQAEAARRAEVEQKRRQAQSAHEQKREALHTKLTQEQMELAMQMKTVREQLGAIAARLRYEQDTSTELRQKVQSENSRLQAEERLLATLRTTAGQTEAQSQESSKALRRMTLDLLQMEQALNDLKAAREKEQHTFSVVPYHGRRGENRRPIYVECTAEGVIFHPERRAMPVFAREFLVGRDKPEQPPDDVRAEVERRIARQRAKQAGAANATPYLLLLVRPDGISMYHQLQHVLKDMTLDFGYEFIDADWVLDFPADDDQPSTQPWMASAPKPPAAPPAPAPRPDNPRPLALTPHRDPIPTSGPATLTLRSREGSGYGYWPGNPGGQAGGVAGKGASAPAGMGPFFSGGTPGTNGGSNVTNAAGQAGGPGPSVAGSANQGGGIGLGAPGSIFGPNRGIGQGHPAAMAPASGNDEIAPGGSGSGGGQGSYVLRGSERSYGQGSPASGSPMPNGSDAPSLGPPRALTPGPAGVAFADANGTGSPGPGYPNSGGSGPPGSTSPGGPASDQPGPYGAGSEANGLPGAMPRGMSISPGGSPTGRYTIARGNNEAGSIPSGSTAGANVPGLRGNGGSGGSEGFSTGVAGLLPPGSPSGTGQGDAGGAIGGAMTTNPSGQPGSTTPGNPGGTSPVPTGQAPTGVAGSMGQGGSGAPSAVPTGTMPPAQPGVAGPSSGHAGGPAPSAESASVYPSIDPLHRPRPPVEAVDEPSEERPPENAAPLRPPRKKLVLEDGGGSGEPADPASAGPSRFATPSYRPEPPRKPASLRPGWVHGGRDWIIYVECRSDGVVLYPAQKRFTLTEAASASAGNPLVAAIKQMIERRQASRRPGEPPYYPQVRLLVRPEYITAFLAVYPALEALPVKKTRQNLQPDDDVRDIVTGSNP